MAIKKVNLSSRRYTYGFPGADYPNLESAVSMARLKFREAQDKYGDKLKEKSFDQSLVAEDTSVYAQLTMFVKVP